MLRVNKTTGAINLAVKINSYKDADEIVDCYAALYKRESGTDELCGVCTAKNITLDAFNKNEFSKTFSIESKELDENFNVKLFIWKSGTLVPLETCVHIEYN